MSRPYTISNTEGRTVGVWPDDFKTRGEAALAIREAMGWDDIAISESYAVDGGRAWSCYSTDEARDANADDGARAPRILEVEVSR